MNRLYKYVIVTVLFALLFITGYSLFTYQHRTGNVGGPVASQEGEDLQEVSEAPEENTGETGDELTKSAGENIYGSWVFDRSVDELTGEENVTAALESENITRAWLDVTRPTLVIRCIGGDLDLLLNTRHQFEVDEDGGEEVDVSYRIDDSQQKNESWKRGPEGKTALAKEPLELADKLITARVLRIEFTPFNAERTGAVFNLEGSGKVITDVAEACGLGSDNMLSVKP